jgi:hypothetical protein
MEGIIPTDPPAGLLDYLLPVFFLITALFRNNVAFLVFYDGRLEWLMLDQRMIDAVTNFRLQNPIDQINWHRLCQHFLKNYAKLPFDLHQRIQRIDWNNVIFFRRTMQVRLVDGRIVYARYIENFGEMHCDRTGIYEYHIKCQIRGADEEAVIPISAIMNHMPSRKVVDEYLKKLAQQQVVEQAKQHSEDYKAQMRERGNIVEFPKMQRNYPLFSEVSMKVLFLLCKRFGIELGFTRLFNRIVRQIRDLGDQSRFPSVELSEADQKDFEAFMKKYMKHFVGRVIVSNTIRFQKSNLPDNLRGLFEIHCYQNQNYSPTQTDVDSFLEKGDEFFTKFAATTSENAMALPDEYWMNPEFGVFTKKKKGYPMCEFLFLMPKDFPEDIFE